VAARVAVEVAFLDISLACASGLYFRGLPTQARSASEGSPEFRCGLRSNASKAQLPKALPFLHFRQVPLVPANGGHSG